MTKIPQIDKHKFGPWAIVTGASSGIGKEMARQLAANGLNLVLVARRQTILEEVGQQLQHQYGVQYRVISGDLSNPQFLPTIFSETADLDIGLLVSNAGTGLPGEFLQLPQDHLLNMVNLNIVAHLSLTHHYGQQLIKRGRGGILFVSALGALQGLPYMAQDSATKVYTINLAEALHTEWAKSGVHVSTLIPGATDTPIVEKFGLTEDMMPIKPMPVEQCVAEGLRALKKNKVTHISGRLNRFITLVLPRRLAVKMNGVLLSKAVLNKA